jgi:hypothetical protein
MSYEDEKKLPTITDAPQHLDGFEDEGDEQESSRVIQGTLVKFTNEATWETGDGEELPPEREYIATRVIRVVQKWKDGVPVATTILAPGEKWPDVKKLNETVPKKEWEEGPGGPRGPYQAQYILHMVDPSPTMDKYTWPTGTVGGGIAMRDLIDKVKFIRSYRDEHVYAVITLDHVYMNTRFGGRQRPHLAVQRWVKFGAGNKALPTPDAPPQITPPTAAEVTGDSVPF